MIDIKEILPLIKPHVLGWMQLRTWSAWTPTFYGFTPGLEPAGAICRYFKSGTFRCAFVEMPNPGTSNNTVFAISAPDTAAVTAGTNWRAPILYAINNGSQLATIGVAVLPANTAIIDLYSTNAAGAWANANGKSASFWIIYEAKQ